MKTTMNTRRDFLKTTAAAAAVTATPLAFAQSNITRVVVGFPAGTSIDNLARMLVEHLRPLLSTTTLLVENKPGAGGQIAMEYLKKSANDGSYFSIVPSPQLTLYPHVYPKLPYDPVNEFEAVSQIAKFPYVLMVGPAVPESVKTLAQFTAWAKAQSKQPIMFSSNAQGSGGHFLGLSYAKQANFQLSYVPYQGGADAVRSLIAGDIPMVIMASGAAMPQARHPKVRLIACTAPTRFSLLPEVPTFVESGYENLVMEEWVGVVMPKGTPSANLEKLANAIKTVIKKSEVKTLLNGLGLDAIGEGPQFTKNLIKTEVERMKPIVKESGFSFDS